MARKRFTSYLPEPMLEKVKDIATWTGRTVPEVMEEAIGKYLKTEIKEERDGFDPATRKGFTKSAGQEWPERTIDVRKGRPIGS